MWRRDRVLIYLPRRMSVYVTTVKKLPLQVRWMSQDSVENSQLARLYTSVKVDAFVEQRRLSRIVTHLTAMRLFSRIVHSFASRLAVTRLPIVFLIWKERCVVLRVGSSILDNICWCNSTLEQWKIPLSDVCFLSTSVDMMTGKKSIILISNPWLWDFFMFLNFSY